MSLTLLEIWLKKKKKKDTLQQPPHRSASHAIFLYTSTSSFGFAHSHICRARQKLLRTKCKAGYVMSNRK